VNTLFVAAFIAAPIPSFPAICFVPLGAQRTWEKSFPWPPRKLTAWTKLKLFILTESQVASVLRLMNFRSVVKYCWIPSNVAHNSLKTVFQRVDGRYSRIIVTGSSFKNTLSMFYFTKSWNNVHYDSLIKSQLVSSN